MEELYKKVYIRSEADLPKHENFLNTKIIFHEKFIDKTRHEDGYSSTWNEYFMKEVDWYLQPIEQQPLQEDEKTNVMNRSELWHKIYSVIQQIPRASVYGDAMDALSASTEVEKLFKSQQVYQVPTDEQIKKLLYQAYDCGYDIAIHTEHCGSDCNHGQFIKLHSQDDYDMIFDKFYDIIKSQIKAVDLREFANDLLDFVGYEHSLKDKFIDLYLSQRNKM